MPQFASSPRYSFFHTQLLPDQNLPSQEPTEKLTKFTGVVASQSIEMMEQWYTEFAEGVEGSYDLFGYKIDGFRLLLGESGVKGAKSEVFRMAQSDVMLVTEEQRIEMRRKKEEKRMKREGRDGPLSPDVSLKT
jgi:hypothetical protein